MNCGICGKKTFVIDTAETKAGRTRRRKCPSNHRQSTIEIPREEYDVYLELVSKNELAELLEKLSEAGKSIKELAKALGEISK